MADMSSSSTTIDASVEDVRAVLFDIEAYPTWSTAIKSVEVHEKDGSGHPTKLTIKVEAGVLKDRATLSYDWSKAPEEISFSLDEADLMTEMDGLIVMKHRVARKVITLPQYLLILTQMESVIQ